MAKSDQMPRTGRSNGTEGQARIVYVGAEQVGLACLQSLVELDKNVVAVFTAHEELEERIADFVPFGAYAAEHEIPLFEVRSTRSPECIEAIRELCPDLTVVISWSQIIPKEILRAGRLGCIGIHYSMLPARRGGAPLSWALIDGLTESGITLLHLDDGIDTGDIIAQKRFDIGPEDTTRTLLDKIRVLAPQIVAENIDALLNGTAPRQRQNESMASYTTRRKPEDSRIDWSQSDEKLHNFIRGLAPPYPSAFTDLGGHRWVIPEAQMIDGRLWIRGYLEGVPRDGGSDAVR